MEEIISSIEEKIAGDICKGDGSVNCSWEEILSLIEEKVAGARRSTPSWKIFSPSYKKYLHPPPMRESHAKISSSGAIFLN